MQENAREIINRLIFNGRKVVVVVLKVKFS
jgi:hypothetical protein